MSVRRVVALLISVAVGNPFFISPSMDVRPAANAIGGTALAGGAPMRIPVH
jgi:hypothetical protein